MFFQHVMVVHVFSTCHGSSCFSACHVFTCHGGSCFFTCHGGSCLLTYVLVVKGLGGWVSDKVGVKGWNVLFLLVFFWQGWQRHRWWQSSSSSAPQKG